MPKFRLPSLLLASVVGLTACGGSDAPMSGSSAPINRTHVVFSPATSELPITNDLLFSSETAADGTMNAGTDPGNPVISGIDALDGRSVLATFDIKFDGSLDPGQSIDASSFVQLEGNIIPNPNQNVFLLPLAYPSGDGLSQASIEGASVEIPTFADAVTYKTAATTMDAAALMELATPTARASIISLDGGSNNVLRITPIEPLMPKTKYLVVVTSLIDRYGNDVARSDAYNLIRDPNTDFSIYGDSGASLAALRPAIQGWESLAAGYFGFVKAVFTAGGQSVPVPTVDDVIFSMTFTTGGTTDVLTYITAPESFFADSLTSEFKKGAIVKTVSGVYQLDGSTSLTEPVDIGTAQTLNVLLTSPTLPDGDTPNPLYNESIAAAIGAGADYATIAGSDPSAGYLIQRAAGEAAISVQNSSTPTIAEQGMGTVSAIANGAETTPANLFPIPAPRTTNFYRVDAASDINPALAAPAAIYQGEITLPYYQQTPTVEDLTPVKTGSWQANATIGAVIDVSKGNPAGTTPPSSMVTYRYPFPTKQTDVTAPIMVVTPDAAALATLAGLGIEYEIPEKWPTIIFAHGITGERSTVLPMANALAFACIRRDEENNPIGLSGAPCYATVVIDQTLHGIAPEGSLVPGLMSVNDPDYDTAFAANVGDNVHSAGLMERHFNVTADAATNPVPMTYDPAFGASGSLFVNLTNFTNVRDNMRQMVLDLLNVNASIATIDVNDDGTPDLDPDNVYFMGHSLGAINGIPFVAVNNSADLQFSPFITSLPKIKAASSMFAGGGIPKLLANSVSFAPAILQGLAAASDALTQGSSGLETYYNVFQGALDSVDPMNFAPMLADNAADDTGTGVLLSLVNEDEVIPNAADEMWGMGPLKLTTTTGFVINGFPAPLAGSEPMIAEFGAKKSADLLPFNDPEMESFDGDGEVLITRYTEGTHRTPITAQPIAVFTELLAETITFFALDGDAVVEAPIISNPGVVED